MTPRRGLLGLIAGLLAAPALAQAEAPPTTDRCVEVVCLEIEEGHLLTELPGSDVFIVPDPVLGADAGAAVRPVIIPERGTGFVRVAREARFTIRRAIAPGLDDPVLIAGRLYRVVDLVGRAGVA